MDRSKIESMAKAMKYVPILVGILCLVFGLLSLFLKMEGEAKQNILYFALFGMIGLVTMVFGIGLSTLFDIKAREEKTSSTDDDDDVNILA